MTKENNVSEIVPVVPGSGIDFNAAIQAATALGEKGVDVLERIHAIHREVRADEARAAFARAMSAFRADMPPVTKCVPGQHGVTHAGTRTRGMYAPLDAITAILNPIAAKHGFSYRFDRERKEGQDWILCVITHEGGHSEVSRFPVKDDTGPGRNAIQATASAEAYGRRYALTAGFAITTADPDDDAQAAGGSPDTITDEQAANLQALAEEVGADRAKFLAWAGVDRLADLPASKLPAAVRMLEAKRKASR